MAIIRKNDNFRRIINPDAEIINNMIDIIFQEVGISLVNDRSNVKLNLLQRGAIQGFLGTFFGHGTRKGIREYIEGMNGTDLDNITMKLQRELDKKKRIK